MTDSYLMAELLEEIYQRLEAGEPVDVSQYAAKHPQLASQLQQLVPAMAVLGELSQSQAASDSPTSEGRHASATLSSLGDFQIVREIGRGGMGVVYEAEQLSLARRVAVKILPFAALWPDAAVQRFRQEVRVAAALEHPHIVPVYSVGCERGVHFYAMKLINGCSLADVIQFRQAAASAELKPEPHSNDPDAFPSYSIGPFRPICPFRPFDQEPNWYHAAARLGRDAAQALAFAHRQGVIHRDIKPSNLLLDGDGHLFVADFGLARSETDVNLTRTGDLLGTPRYMSPEQAAGDSKQLDPRTDIFSLGATLYELLTFRPVIAARGQAAAIRALKQLKVIPPRTHDRHIPRPLEQIVLTCLQPNPGDRYRTAAELADDLQRFLERRPIAARPPGLTRRTSRVALGAMASASGAECQRFRCDMSAPAGNRLLDRAASPICLTNSAGTSVRGTPHDIP